MKHIYIYNYNLFQKIISILFMTSDGCDNLYILFFLLQYSVAITKQIIEYF